MEKQGEVERSDDWFHGRLVARERSEEKMKWKQWKLLCFFLYVCRSMQVNCVFNFLIKDLDLGKLKD